MDKVTLIKEYLLIEKHMQRYGAILILLSCRSLAVGWQVGESRTNEMALSNC